MMGLRRFEIWVLAMLVMTGLVIPSHGTRCEGCLMQPIGPTAPVSVASTPASEGCAKGCCGGGADRAEKPTESERSPCEEHENCDGSCDCPGACCSTGQTLALARVASADLTLPVSDRPVLGAEPQVCARDAALALLRPPRS